KPQSMNCKMCAVIQHHLGQRIHWRVPVQRYSRGLHTRPENPTVTVLPVKHAREISLSLHPASQGFFAPTPHVVENPGLPLSELGQVEQALDLALAVQYL